MPHDRWTPAQVREAHELLLRVEAMRGGRAALQRAGARANVEIQGAGPWVNVRGVPVEPLINLFTNEIALIIARLGELGVTMTSPEQP